MSASLHSGLMSRVSFALLLAIPLPLLAEDYGDAPLAAQSGFAGTYPVLQSDGGAWHLAAGPSLGTDRDEEADGQPSAVADGDSADEDGVTLVPLQAGADNEIIVNSSDSAFLDAWVDWNRDGDWDDAGEQIASSLALLAGDNPVSVAAPPGLSHGFSFARFRISTDGGLPVGDGALDGEVEDYQISLLGLGSISGSVLADLDNDDIGDIGISGVELTLVDSAGDPVDGDPGTPGVQPVTTLTDGGGAYSFSGLIPGDYGIVESQPAGYFSVSDADAGDPDEIRPISVLPAADTPGNDFTEEEPGVISGSVLDDVDNDDVGDLPLGVVSVALYSDPDADGDPVDGVLITGTDTDESGAYTFSDLPPGAYVVVESQPLGYFDAFDGDNTDPGDDAANISVTDNLIPVAVLAGETDDGNEFIEEQPGSLSGSVLVDVDNDNLGDAGIEGVNLLLVDSGGNAVDGNPATPEVDLVTATTGMDGAYSFNGLPPGVYGVVEEHPAGYLSVTDADEEDPDFIYLITVIAGQDTFGNDFIEELPGSLSGRVLTDDDYDGIGDTGLEGVTVMLVDFTGNPIDADSETPGLQPVTNDTVFDGSYSFTDLPPGIYGVVEIQPIGYLSVGDRDGGNPNEIRPINVVGGAEDLGNEFVEVLPVAIGSSIFADTNANGFRDGAESGVPPVQVQLRFDANNDGDLDDPGESTPVQTLVAIGGNYSFSNLRPGNYQIVIPAPPVGYGLSSPNTSAADDGEDNDDNGIQSAAGDPTFSPVITLLPGTEPDLGTDGSDASTDSTVDFGFTSPSPANWIAWQNLNPLGGQNNPNDNPDGDLSDNLLEFAFSRDPQSGVPENTAGLQGFSLQQDPGGGFLTEVIRPIGLTGVGYTLEYTSAPGPATAWTSNDDITGIVPVVTSLGNGFESVHWENLESIPELSGGKGFVRIRVEELDLELTAWTEVQGWLDHSVASQSETYCNPFLKREVFSGTGDAGSPQDAINVTGSAANTDINALLAGKQGLYVEILAGPLEGHRFAVNPDTSDADTIAVMPGHAMNTVAPIPDLSDAVFVVREAWIFGELFPASTFQSGGDLNTADNILTFSPVTQTWTTYFLADLGGFGTYWVDSADVSGPPPASQNGRPLNPAEGIYFHRRGPGLTAPLMGIVRENGFRCPLVEGYNLIGGGYPLDQSYNSRGMTLPAGFDGDTDIRRADQVMFWEGDSTPGLVSYNTVYLLDAGAPYQRWVSAGDSFVTPLDNTSAFKAGRSVFIKRSASLGDYTVGAPWAP
jgi:hypothetical protein